jgi:hypothetical protein
MHGARKWLGKACALLVLAGATAVGAVASAPSGDGWTADPDSQFLLDVKLHQYRLGDGVRAYNTPEGTCIIFGDFITTLDVPIKIDLASKKATGWAFQETNRISIDEAAGTASYGGKSEKLPKGAIRQTPEGWCADSAALSRWFGIGVKPVTSGSVLLLQTEAKLPVELALEREERAKSLHPAKIDLSTLPQVKLPYRMWRAPALDFVVSGGATYLAGSGMRVDRQASVYAAGEIADLSYDVQAATTQKGAPSELRFRAYRSDPNGNLLGPLHATNVAVGDVDGFATRLSGVAEAGRGAVVTNMPLTTPTAFDRQTFEGDLPSGWEAELYRNGELMAFAKSDPNQRYVFADVPLLYGDNQIRIVLYGPQGQVRAHEETINIGEQNVPPGKTWYWAGFNQPGRDLVNLERPVQGTDIPKFQAAVAVQHGIDDRTSVGLLARQMLIDDQQVTFVEGAVRRSIGPAMVEVSAARDSGGGTAAHAQLLGKFGSVNVNAEALIATNYHLPGEPVGSRKEARLAVDAPVHIGRAYVPVHGDVHYTQLADGSSQLEAAGRLSTTVDRFNLAADIRYDQQSLAHGPSPPPQIYTDLLGSGRVGPVRLRGAAEFEVSPGSRLRTAELDAYWSGSENVDWEGTLAYDSPGHRGRVGITHINRFRTMALAVTGEAATDGSFAVGFNLNFSLDSSHGFAMSRDPLAGAGVVHARVFEDLNGNGIYDPGEPLEKGVQVTTGTTTSQIPTAANGTLTVGGLTPFKPIAVGIDTTTLSNPMLTPKTALQVVVPRPGVAADVDIPLVGGGDIEGALVKSGGVGFEGLDLELVDASGKVIDTARTDYDGFFLFDRVPYGSYSIRISKAAADAVQVTRDLNVEATVSHERTVVRVGTIQVRPLPKIASIQ